MRAGFGASAGQHLSELPHDITLGPQSDGHDRAGIDVAAQFADAPQQVIAIANELSASPWPLSEAIYYSETSNPVNAFTARLERSA